MKTDDIGADVKAPTNENKNNSSNKKKIDFLVLGQLVCTELYL